MFDKFKCKNDVFFEIREAKNNFYGIFCNSYGHYEFITHKPTLRQAQKLCKLLKMFYNEGYTDGHESSESIYNT